MSGTLTDVFLPEEGLVATYSLTVTDVNRSAGFYSRSLTGRSSATGTHRLFRSRTPGWS
jgi:hypothetical protein